LIQEAFYYQNKDLNDLASYESILEDLSLDKELFRTKFNSTEYKELVKEDFKSARELGVNSFPTLLYQSGNKLTVVASGYSSAEKVTAAINAARKK